MQTLRISRILLIAVLMMTFSSTSRASVEAAGNITTSIRLRIFDGRPVVDEVWVNGHGPYRFLLDTGATVNLIESDLAKSIGLPVTFHDDLSSAGGMTAVAGSDGVEIQLGQVMADHQMFIFSDLKALHNLSPDIRGVIGQSFLARFDYLLDLRNKRIEFGERDWQGIRASLKMLNARPAVSTNLGWVVLDSGTKTVFLFGVKAGEATQSVRTLSGSLETGTVPTKNHDRRHQSVARRSDRGATTSKGSRRRPHADQHL
jgi:hypothetical protein